jgi:PAS domain S-box-containing protein
LPTPAVPMSRVVVRWLVSLSLTLATPVASVHAPEPSSAAPDSFPAAARSGALPLLTRAQQIRTLTPDEANRGYPVRLRAVVTYIDPAEGDFFVQDATAGIFLNDLQMPQSPPQVRVGDLVEVSGATEDLDFAPQIGKPEVRVLGRALLPKPREVGFDALVSTREDSQWVQFDGVVQAAVREGNSVTLELSGDGGHLQAHILDARSLDPDRLIDARVRIEGVCGSGFNQRNQLISVDLRIPGARQLTVLDPPPADPFKTPVRSLSSLLAFTAAGAQGHRVRVQGTVTLQRPKGIFIQDGSQGLYVPRFRDQSVSVGDRVELVGFPDVGDYTPVLMHAICRRIGSGALPAAVPVTAARALTGAFDTMRVRIDATLRGEGYSETDRTLILQEGDTLFEARLEKSLAPRRWKSPLPPGTRLRLTGVCSVNVDRNRAPDGFNILLRSPDDIEVLARPSWWNFRRTLLLAGLCGGLTIAVLAWVVILRRRVKQQTEVIRRQVQSEAELQKRYEYAVRATQDTIWDWDLLAQTICWSEGISTVFGYPPEEACADAKWWQRRIHPEDAERVQRSLEKTVASGGGQWSAEYRVQRAGGNYAHVLDRGYVMYDSSGAPCRMICATMDITAQKQAEEQLAHERNLLRTLIDTMPDYIYVKDLAGRLLMVNRTLAELLGVSSADTLLGKTDFDCYPEELARSFWVDDRKVMDSGQALINREETNVDFRGNANWVLTTKVPLRDREGKVVGLMGVGRNITSRKQAEKEVEKARDAAEAANRAKGEFLANMSHEIRTPLNGILGMTELALDTALDSEQREYLEAVKLSADSLLNVVNDILDFSKIEAGKLDLSPEDFDLRTQLRDVVKLMTVPARLKGLHLGSHTASDVPHLIHGDPTRLRQIVLNLVGNAVKFTEQGEVVVEVFREAEDRSEVVLHFVVRDTGIGIAGPKQKAIFEAFVQADGSATRRFGGTGLGLTISSRLVQMMGGRIWVESEEGQGSRFHFTARFEVPVPTRQELETETAVVSAGSDDGLTRQQLPAGSRILLAEDNSVNRIFIVRLLEKHGHRVVTAVDGREALEAFTKSHFDLVLMDVQMPGMDGLETTAAIRELQKGSSLHVPIVALTAHALKGDRERCLAAGMDGYLSKPVHADELFETVDSFLRQGADGKGSATWEIEQDAVSEGALSY